MTTPLSALTELRDAINAHDPDRIAGCFSDDYRCERPHHPGQSFTGNDQVRRNYAAMLAQVSDLTATILRTAVNDHELWSEWELRATDPNGRMVLRRGPVIATVREGRINWTLFYIDPVNATDSDTSAGPPAS